MSVCQKNQLPHERAAAPVEEAAALGPSRPRAGAKGGIARYFLDFSSASLPSSMSSLTR